ncbi:MAG: aspartate kinase [Phycisphaeraceae bacterium]
MSIKIAKFGGSSLADATQIRKVKAIVLSDPDRRYIIPSAPGKRSEKDQKITDLLYLCHEHVRQGVAFGELFAIIAERYREIVQDLGLSLDMQPHLEEVRENIADGATADYTASRGEYLNGIILADMLGYDFVDAAEIIHFDQRGRFDQKQTHEAIRDRLKKHERAVIPGFYGSRPDGRVKTFSRGGSDITGAIIARGVSADIYENWTDVDGLLMADPRIIAEAKHIEKLTYRELRELAYMGATVLHDEAIFPVRQAGIPVNIRNTNSPERPGTIIVQDAAPITHKGIITGIAGRKDFTAISIEKALMNGQVGFARRLLEAVEKNDINFEHMPSGIDTISVIIADSELEGKLESVLEDIEHDVKPDSVEVDPDLALIATVGRGMAQTPGMAARLFRALADANVNIRMIDQGSSELNIIVGVNAADFELALRSIYDEFVE